MLSTPYTRWEGDRLHGQYPKLTPVWVRLERVYPRVDGASVQVVAEGLDLTGSVPGLLSGWFRTVQGDWLGVVNFEIPYADGRPNRVRLADQLVPGHALRPRDESKRA